MARIPVYEAQQGLDTDRGGAPKYQPLDATAGALQGLGRSISSVADDVFQNQERLKREQQAQDDFKLRVDLGTLQDQLNADHDQLRDTEMPETGQGFSARFQEGAQKRITDFLAGIKDPKLKAEYEIRARAVTESYRLKGDATELGARQTYQRNSIAKRGTDIQAGVNANPDTWQAGTKAINDLIDGAPDLSPADKAELKSKTEQFMFDAAISGYIRSKQFDKAEDAVSGRFGGAKPKALPGKSQVSGSAAGRAAQARAFFESKGWSPAQAAGIVGNLLQESGLKTSAKNHADPGTSVGIGQWNRERKARLYAFANARGTSWADYRTQLEFVQHELETTERGSGAALKRAQSVEAATEIMIGYERPAGWSSGNPRGGHGFANRLNYARQALGGAAGDIPAQGPPTPPQPGAGSFTQADAYFKDIWNARKQVQLRENLATKQQYSDQFNSFLNGISAGEVGEVGLREAEGAWLVDFEDRKKARSALKDYQEEQGQASDFVTRVVNNEQVDVTDPKNQKALDRLMEANQIPQRLAQNDPEAAGQMFAFWRKTGMIGNRVKGALLSAYRSGDDTAQIAALKNMAGLQNDNARAFSSEFTAEVRADVEAYKSMVDANFSTQEIVEAMRKTRDIPPEVHKAREKFAEDQLESLTAEGIIDKQFDTLFSIEPSLSEAPGASEILLHDYKSAYKFAYARTADTIGAHRYAQERVAQLWAVSEVNGGRLTRMPPERTYRNIEGMMVNGSLAWMREHAEELLIADGEFTMKNVLIPGQGRKLEKKPVVKDFQFVADPQTRAEMEAGLLPSYMIYIVDEDGISHFANDKATGKFRRIAWDRATWREAFDKAAVASEKERKEGLPAKQRADDLLKDLDPTSPFVPLDSQQLFFPAPQ